MGIETAPGSGGTGSTTITGAVEVTNDSGAALPVVDTAAGTKLDTLITDNGAAGTSPTSGSGILGFLRSIYDKIALLPTASPLTDTQLRATSVPVLPGGNVAHDAVDAGNPLKIGGVARLTNPTAVGDGDRVDASFDKLGKLITVGSLRALKAPQTTTITASTAETTIVTAVSGAVLDLYGIILTNTSNTAVAVTIKDSTAGTTRFVFSVPASASVGFMLPEGGAWKQATANNNWTATSSSSITSLIISAFAVQNAA